MSEIFAGLIGAALTGGVALIQYFLDRDKKRAQIRALEAETDKLQQEAEYYKKQLEIRKKDQCVFDDVAKLRNFTDSIADLFSYFTYFEWLRWQGRDESPGATQHFLSMHRKHLENLVLNLGGIGSIESGGMLYLLGDVLYAALSADNFLNEVVDPLLKEKPRNLRNELRNVYRRAFNEAI